MFGSILGYSDWVGLRASICATGLNCTCGSTGARLARIFFFTDDSYSVCAAYIAPMPMQKATSVLTMRPMVRVSGSLVSTC